MSPKVKKWLGLVVTSLALAIIIIDTTVLNVSLRNIIADLHTDIISIQWVITTYSLVLAALTITGGRLGDLYGRKRMFMIGATLFGVGSLIASFSTSVPMLLFGWSIVEGVGAALMMPATASLVVANFHGKERAMAFGIWGGVAGASSALGPILGGYLTTNYSWHWAFRINVLIVLLVLLGSIVIKESIDKKEKHELDIIGVILSSLGLSTLVYGVIESSTYGWWSAKKAWEIFSQTYTLGGVSITPIAIAVGLLFLSIFVWWEQKRQQAGKTPLITLGIFKSKEFTASVITMAILSMGQAGMFFALPVFLQSVRGLDALNTGLALLPLSLAVLVGAPLSAGLGRKFSPKLIIQVGIACGIVATILLSTTLSIGTTAWQLAPGLAIFGFGMGLMMGQISNMALSAVDINYAGEASGINNTMRQVGQSFGSALLGAIFLSVLVSSMTTGITNSSVLPAPAKQALTQAVEKDSSGFEFGGSSMTQMQAPQKIKDEVTSIVHQASTDASKRTLLFTAVFSSLSLLASIFLPKQIRHAEGAPAAAH